MSRQGKRLALLVVTALSAPATAHACAVCGGGNPANRFAIFVSTVALSLLPLGLFVGAFLWLRSRIRTQSADPLSERAVAMPARPAPAHPLPAATTPDTR